MLLSSEAVADKLQLSINSIRVYAQKHGVGRKIAGRWFFNARDLRVLSERNVTKGAAGARKLREARKKMKRGA